MNGMEGTQLDGSDGGGDGQGWSHSDFDFGSSFPKAPSSWSTPTFQESEASPATSLDVSVASALGASGAVRKRYDDRIANAVMGSCMCWLCSEELEKVEEVTAQGGPNRLMHLKCWNGWKCLKRICETNVRMKALIAELMKKNVGQVKVIALSLVVEDRFSVELL